MRYTGKCEEIYQNRVHSARYNIEKMAKNDLQE